jgi:peptidoglycan/LPS O-acetylase OafA/YrhL
MTSVRSSTRSTSRRQIALVVVALMLGLLFAYPGSGLLLGWSSTEAGGIHRFHTVLWGMHTGLMLSVGLFALVVRTEDRVATAQQVAVAMAVMMTVFFGILVIPHFGEPGLGIDRVVFSIMVLVLTGVVLALHPRRGELLPSGRRISKPMAALGLVGLAVAAPYALDQIQIQLAADLATDPHSAPGKEHWVEMASAALTLPLIAFVAALRARGFRLVAWTAGIGTMVFGAASVLLPEQASSPGVAWGAFLLVGGALFIAVAEIEASREAPRVLANDDPSRSAERTSARRAIGRGGSSPQTDVPRSARGSS